MSFHVIYDRDTHSISVSDYAPLPKSSASLDSIARAMESIRRMGPGPIQFDTVENEDGLAVLKRGGHVVGWMSWDEFDELAGTLKPPGRAER